MPDDDLEIISVSPTDSGGGDDEFLPASAVKATEGGDEFLPASAVAPAPKADIRSLALKRKRTLLSAAPDDGSLANELEFNQTALPRSTSLTGSLYSDRTAQGNAPTTSDSPHLGGALPPAVVNTLTDPFHRLTGQFSRSSDVASQLMGAAGKKIADTIVPADKPVPTGDSYQARKDAIAVARENELAALLRGVTEKGMGSVPKAAEWGLATASGAALPATARAIAAGLTGAYFGGEGVGGVLDAASRIADLSPKSGQQERADAYGDLVLSGLMAAAPLHAKATVARELAAGRPGPEPGGRVSPPDDLADMEASLRTNQAREPVPHPIPDLPLDPRDTIVPERLTTPADVAPQIPPDQAAAKVASLRDQREALSALLSQTTSLSARQKIRTMLDRIDAAEDRSTGGGLATPHDQLAAQYGMAEDAVTARNAEQPPSQPLPEFPGESQDALLANAAQSLAKQAAPSPNPGPADSFGGKQALERRLSRVDPDRALADILGMKPSELPGNQPRDVPPPAPLSVPSLWDRKMVRDAAQDIPIEGGPSEAEISAAAKQFAAERKRGGKRGRGGGSGEGGPPAGGAGGGPDGQAAQVAGTGRRTAAAEASSAVLADQDAMMAELNAAIAENNRLKEQLAKVQAPPASENPAPEPPATIEAQRQMLAEGRKNALLVPEQTGHAAPEPPPGRASLKTDAGTILYDPAKVNPDELAESARTGQGLGEKLFGEGVPDRPASPNPDVVTLRSPDGLELQSAAAEPPDVPAVQQAFERVAKPGETVEVAPESKIVEERLKPQEPAPPTEGPLAKRRREQLEQRLAALREKWGRAKEGPERDAIDDKIEQTSLDLEGEPSGAMPPEMAAGFEDWKRRALPSLEPTLRQIAGEGAEGLSGDALVDAARKGIGLEDNAAPGKLLKLPKRAKESAPAATEAPLKPDSGAPPSAVPEPKLLGHIPQDRVMEIKRAEAAAEGSKFKPALRDNGDGTYSLVTMGKDGKRVAGKPFRPLAEPSEATTPLAASEPTTATGPKGKSTVYRSFTLGSGFGALGENPGEVVKGALASAGKGLQAVRDFANDPGNVLETRPVKPLETKTAEATDAQIAHGRIGEPWSWKRVAKGAKDLYQSTVRSTEAVQAFDDVVKPDRPRHEKASELMKLGPESRAEEAFREGPLGVDKDGNFFFRTDVPSLKKSWEGLSGKVREFGRAAVLRRAVEVVEGDREKAARDPDFAPRTIKSLTGIDTTLPDAIAEVESAPEAVWKAAAGTSDFLNSGVDLMVESGALAKSVGEKMKLANKAYINYGRVFGGESLGHTTMKKLGQSARRIGDPVLTTIQHYTDMVRAAHNAQVRRAILQAAIDDPTAAEAMGVKLTDAKSPTPVEEAAVQRLMDEYKEGGVPITEAEAREIAEAMGQVTNVKDRVVSAWMPDGTHRSARVNDAMADALSSLTPKEIDSVAKIMLGIYRAAAQAFKMGTVAVSPVFWLNNALVRDVKERFVKTPGMPSASDVLNVPADTIRGLISSFRHDRLVKEYALSGAGHSSFAYGPKGVKRMARELLPKTTAQKFITIVNPAEWWRAMADVGEHFEAANRIAAIAAEERRAAKENRRLSSIDKGVTAAEATTNFRMGGSSQAFQGVISGIPFLRPGIAAVDQLARKAGAEAFARGVRQSKATTLAGMTKDGLRAAKGDAAALLARGAVLCAVAAARYYYNTRVAPNKDIEDARKSKNGLLWSFWQIPGTDIVIREARAHAIDIIFQGGTEAVLDKLSQDDPEAFNRLMDGLGNSLSVNVMPQWAKIAHQLSANKDDFDRPIVPESLTNLKGEGLQHQYTDRTSRLARVLGTAASGVNSLPDVIKSPAKLDYLIGQLGGTAAVQGSRLLSMAMPREEGTGPAPTPALADILGPGSQFARIPSASGYESEKYYKGRREAESAATELRQLENLPDSSAGSYAQRRADEIGPVADLADRYREANQAIADIRNEIKAVASDPSIKDPQEKRRRIDALTRELNNIFRMVNEEMASLRSQAPAKEKPAAAGVPFS